MTRTTSLITFGALALAVPLAALAHPQAGAHLHDGGAAAFLAGFTHPFTGLDHLLAMLAVGIWSARRPNPKLLPLSFLAMLLLGVLTGVAGLAIPGLETGIALTVALLGCVIAVSLRLSAPVAAAMVGGFALLHGNAHGHELPQAASAMGLLLASAALVAGGSLIGRHAPALALKWSGAAIAAVGVALVATL